MAGKDITTPERKVPDIGKIPAALTTFINPVGWINSMLYGDTYAEPDPDFISKMLTARAIFAESDEEAFSAMGVKRLQKWVADRPGETTGPLELTDLYVAASDFETGNPTYVLMSAVHLESGEELKISTGATNIQGTLIGLLRLGRWPIRFQVKRGDSKDKGGRYLLHMLPPD